MKTNAHEYIQVFIRVYFCPFVVKKTPHPHQESKPLITKSAK